MKTITIILIGIICLSLFTIGYYFILDKMNYGVMSYDKYYGLNGEKTPCEFKQLDNGFTQLEDCSQYKLKRDR